MSKNKTALSAAVVVAVAIGIYAAVSSSRPAEAPSRAPAQYTNATYGYAFSYPGRYSVHAYTPQYVSVGMPHGDGFDSLTDASVALAEAGDTYASFDDFVHKKAELTCAADGPTASIDCPAVSRTQSFTSAAGLQGELFYLTQVTRAVPGGATSTAVERGPFFAYNISANAPEAPFAALIIAPPSAQDPAQINASLVESIAESVQINKVETR